MKIAVDTGFLTAGHRAEYGPYRHELLKKLAEQHPEHQFVFFCDRDNPEKYLSLPHCTTLHVDYPKNNLLSWKGWYDLKLPALLKKHRADAWLACNGICSLRTRVPQCLLVTDLSFLHHPSLTGRFQRFFYRRYTPQFLQKAIAIAVTSGLLKNDLVTNYGAAADKITVLPAAPLPDFLPAEEEEKELTREKHTEGLNYFLYTGTFHPRKNGVSLLRAFSAFKKRQQSNWKLVLAGTEPGAGGELVKKLQTYKYREEVVLLPAVEPQELVKITGAAYALVYPSVWEGTAGPVTDALQSGVPVITSAGSPMQEMAGDAVLYADPADHRDIAEKMMRLYKDEALRQGLVEKGKQRAGLYSWDAAAAQLWQSLAACLPG